MKRRGFIATLLGAAGYRPSLKAAAPPVDLQDAARTYRYFIARDWPRDQRRMDFIMKGEITGFTHGWCWTGPAWHKLERPMKIGDTVNVRKPTSMVAQARRVDGHIFFDFGPETTEAVTLTPEFMKTNGFPMPSIHAQYVAGRMNSEPVTFKWFMDDAKVFIAGD